MLPTSDCERSQVPMEHALCEACGGPRSITDSEPLRVTTSNGQEISYSRCLSCGLLAMTPFPDAETIAGFYTSEYYGFGETKFSPLVDRARDLFLKRRSRLVLRELGRPGRVLDVGCGDGRFLGHLRRAGCEVFGTELEGPASHRASQVPGIHLITGELVAGLFAARSFDAITLWHVLEHLPKPAHTLALCADLLKPGGLLVLEVPNLQSVQSRWFGAHAFNLDPPRHVYQFVPRAMRALIARRGFHIERKATLSFEMGVIGATQSWLNTFITPRDLFFDMLRTRNRCSGTPASKAMSVCLGCLSLPLSVCWEAVEASAGAGAVLQYVCRKRDEPRLA